MHLRLIYISLSFLYYSPPIQIFIEILSKRLIECNEEFNFKLSTYLSMSANALLHEVGVFLTTFLLQLDYFALRTDILPVQQEVIQDSFQWALIEQDSVADPHKGTNSSDCYSPEEEIAAFCTETIHQAAFQSRKRKEKNKNNVY